MKRINVRNHAEFRGNWSKRYRDIVIPLPRYRDFPTSKMVAVHQLGFLKVRIFETESCSECYFAFSCHIFWNSVKPLSRYGDFLNFVSKWRPSAILDSLCACLDNPQTALSSVYDLAGIDAVVSTTRRYEYTLIAFGLKCLFTLRKWIWGDLTP